MIIRVLVIDHDASALARIQNSLKQVGDFEVVVFMTGQAATEYAAQDPPSVAVVALTVHDVAPGDLIANLRQHNPMLPVIIHVPEDMPDVDESFLDSLEAQAILRGTYSARTLVELIESILDPNIEPVFADSEIDEIETSKVPAHDSPALRQYLATSVPGDDPETFGEVLKSLEPDTTERPLEDTFNELVDSLHAPEDRQSLLKRHLQQENGLPSLEEDALYAKLAAEEPPMPTLEDSGTIRDLIAVTDPDFAETPTPEPKDIPDEMIADSGELATWDKDDDAETPPGPATEVLEALIGTDVTLGATEHNLLAALAEVSDTPISPLPSTTGVNDDRPDLLPIPDDVFAQINGLESGPDAPTAPPDEPVKKPAIPPRQPAQPQTVSPHQDVDIAEFALSLTQYSLESSAHAIILIRRKNVLAATGTLPEKDVAALARMIDGVAVRESGKVQIKFASLPQTKVNYLIIATPTIDDMVLLMVFTDDVPLGTIRNQAKQLAQALENTPETVQEAAQKAAQEESQESAGVLTPIAPELAAPDTLPEATPTDPSEDIRGIAVESAESRLGSTTTVEPESVDGTSITAEAEDAQELSLESREATESAPAVDPATLTKYACAWILRDPEIELDSALTVELNDWLHEIILAQHWLTDTVDVQPHYVSTVVSVPPKETPSEIVTFLMTETAQRVLDAYPELALDTATLWADAYYVIAPGRPLTDEEIKRFISYQREA